jgi:phage gpG-like protein
MSKFHFDQKAAKFRSQKSAILEKMANNAVYQFKVVNFDRASFDGKPWAPRKVADGSRQMLVRTGRMRQSITIISRSADRVIVGSLVPYAKYHNEGTKNLPQRKFIGKSKDLDLKNKRVLLDAVKRIA